MAARTKTIRLKVDDAELAELDRWRKENDLANYPRSSTMRLFQKMAIRLKSKPTPEEIREADAVKLKKGQTRSDD